MLRRDEAGLAGHRFASGPMAVWSESRDRAELVAAIAGVQGQLRAAEVMLDHLCEVQKILVGVRSRVAPDPLRCFGCGDGSEVRDPERGVGLQRRPCAVLFLERPEHVRAVGDIQRIADAHPTIRIGSDVLVQCLVVEFALVLVEGPARQAERAALAERQVHRPLYPGVVVGADHGLGVAAEEGARRRVDDIHRAADRAAAVEAALRAAGT